MRIVSASRLALPRIWSASPRAVWRGVGPSCRCRQGPRACPRSARPIPRSSIRPRRRPAFPGQASHATGPGGPGGFHDRRKPLGADRRAMRRTRRSRAGNAPPVLSAGKHAKCQALQAIHSQTSQADPRQGDGRVQAAPRSPARGQPGLGGTRSSPGRRFGIPGRLARRKETATKVVSEQRGPSPRRSIHARSAPVSLVDVAVTAGRGRRPPRTQWPLTFRETSRRHEEGEEQIQEGPFPRHPSHPCRRRYSSELIVSALDIRAGREVRSRRITSPRHQAVESQSRKFEITAGTIGAPGSTRPGGSAAPVSLILRPIRA